MYDHTLTTSWTQLRTTHIGEMWWMKCRVVHPNVSLDEGVDDDDDDDDGDDDDDDDDYDDDDDDNW